MKKVLDYLLQEITLKDYSVKLWVLLLIGVALCLFLAFIITTNVGAKKEKAKQKQLQKEASQCLATQESVAQLYDIKESDKSNDLTLVKPTIQEVEPIVELVTTEQEVETVTEPIVLEKPEEQPIKKLDVEKETNKELGARFEIALKKEGYKYILLASDNQLLYESVGYTTPNGAIKGIDAFKNAVAKGGFVIDVNKMGEYRFSLNRRYVGENCSSESDCKKIVQLIENVIADANVVPYEKDDAQEKAYSQGGFGKKIDTIEWEEVEQKEAGKTPKGKFEIEKGNSGYYFYLADNKDNYLYFSDTYASIATVKENIKTFKRAVYSGVFGVDKNYQDNQYRFVLKGGNSVYLGRYYDTLEECENNISAIKEFGKSASLPN